jgi:hypothetical protein
MKKNFLYRNSAISTRETSAGEQTKRGRRLGDEERGRRSDEMIKIKHDIKEEVGEEIQGTAAAPTAETAR